MKIWASIWKFVIWKWNVVFENKVSENKVFENVVFDNVVCSILGDAAKPFTIYRQHIGWVQHEDGSNNNW